MSRRKLFTKMLWATVASLFLHFTVDASPETIALGFWVAASGDWS